MLQPRVNQIRLSQAAMLQWPAVCRPGALSEPTVSNELWNVVGALLIVTAMLASHPIKPAVAQRIENRIAMNWGQLETAETACPAGVPCLMPVPIQ